MRKNYSKLVIAFSALWLMAASSCSNSDEVQSVYSSVHDLNEIQFASTTVSKIYTVRDASDEDKESAPDKYDILGQLKSTLNSLEQLIKIGDRIGVYGIRCNYAAVIDLNNISEDDISVSNGKNGVKEVTINLPKVQVKSLGTEFETQVYHERKSGLRSAISETERTNMRREATEMLNKELSEDRNQQIDELRTAAEEKAVDFFTTMLKNMGYTAKVTIKQ
ncbi:MAG: DUF4230 domain-containing protein [Muribaculaceae bacterium]